MPTTPATTRARGYSAPYTAPDDERLVLCWIEVSKLFRSKTGPTKEDDFWATLAVVNGHVLGCIRDEISLRTRWEKIQQDTLKFSQYYYELKREKEAESEKSRVKSAAARFVELEKRPFEFEFLWSFHLRYQPAWMEGGKAAEGQPDDGADAADATHSRHSSTTVLSHLQLDAHHHHQAAHTSAGASHLGGNIVGVLHPSGSALTSRKEAPATSPTRAVTSESQPKKKKTTTSSNQASLLTAMAGWNEHIASMDATDLTHAEQERERLRIEDRRLQLQRDTLERTIIDMDLARLPDDLARQFYRLRKKAILQNLGLTSKPAPSSSAAAAAASVPLPASVVASSSRPSLFFQ